MTAYQQIDEILKILYENSNGIFEDDILNESIKRKSHDNKNAFDQMLKKLIKDGYLTDNPSKDNPNKSFYFISFEGRLFFESGGYKQKIIDDASENTRLDKIEMSQKVNRRWMTGLTLILAVASLLAGLYYCVELYWKHHWFH